MVLIYLIPYLVLFFLSLIVDQSRSSKFYWFFIFILALFSGLRYDVGYDYQSYTYKIEESLVYNFEPINVWIVMLCNKLNYSQLFFIVHSFITLFTLGYAFNRISTRPSFTLILFIGFPLLFLNTMSVVRFWTALSIVFLGSVFLYEGSIKKYLILLIVAVGFHTSAVAGFLFILFKYIKIPLRINCIIIVCSFIISFFSKTILGGMEYGSNIYMQLFSEYVNKDEMASGLSIIPFILLGFDILFLYYYKRLSHVDKKAETLITIYNIGCCIMLIMSFNTTLSIRLSRYFTIYLLIIIPYIVAFIGNKSLFGNKAMWIIMSLFFYIYQLCIFNDSLMKYEFLPYKLCINVF